MSKKSKKPKAGKTYTEPKWKTVEKVVALLEKSLAPGSRVRHDVELPHIVTGHPIQCDVVIESGDAPRTITTIVEVQKRKERVKPNDFRGWCTKREQVGAHRLICVSYLPFPKSIKDDVAKRIGPVVLLVRLEELEQAKWPFRIINNGMNVFKPYVEPDYTIPHQFAFPPDKNVFRGIPARPFHTDEKVILREGNPELLPMRSLLDEGVKRLCDETVHLRLPEGEYTFPMHWRPKGVSLSFDGLTAPLESFSVTMKMTVKAHFIPFVISSYTQEGEKTLAWVGRAKGTIDGEEVEIRQTFLPNSQGGFDMAAIEAHGFKDGGLLFWGTA